MFTKKKVVPETEEAQTIKQEINNPGTLRKLQPVQATAPVVEEQPEEVEEQTEQEEATAESLTEEDIVKALTEERNLLLNHDARISAIEAALFRLKALI